MNSSLVAAGNAARCPRRSSGGAVSPPDSGSRSRAASCFRWQSRCSGYTGRNPLRFTFACCTRATTLSLLHGPHLAHGGCDQRHRWQRLFLVTSLHKGMALLGYSNATGQWHLIYIESPPGIGGRRREQHTGRQPNWSGDPDWTVNLTLSF